MTDEKGQTVSVGSDDLFSVLEAALREAEENKSGARLADYSADITEAIRRARRMDWHMRNAAAIAKERCQLYMAGESLRAAYAAHIGTDKSARLRDWDEAAQPMRDMTHWMSSLNSKDEPRGSQHP